ncbi:metal ABC transporter solute-binding protein, Zn/Mn family [Salininema proteolyticum]|uniref:Metal ABC transporter solute-binding protein, Zn/Mn family n=1 Tax=Salininema proteolyticum TaxID=1607685 RepID=A0ABV8TSB0_9ACTN
MRKNLFLTVPALALAAGSLAACGNEGSGADDGKLSVVAGFYPLAFAAEQVGGDHVAVTDLTPPGEEAHELELKPDQMAEVVDADLVVHLDDFIPSLDKAVEEYASDNALDAAEGQDLLTFDGEIDSHDDHGGEEGHDDHGHEGEEGHDDHGEEEGHEAEEGHDHDHGSVDPHLWLDPTRYAKLGDAIADRLAEIDADNADDYRANAEAFGDDLAELDAKFTESVEGSERDDIVTSHAAFGYLADRYDLDQIAIAGLSPDQEPAPARMAEISDYIKEEGVTTVFFETVASPAVAETVARESGAETATLNPLESLTAEDLDAGDDYFSVMEANLAALEKALN